MENLRVKGIPVQLLILMGDYSTSATACSMNVFSDSHCVLLDFQFSSIHCHTFLEWLFQLQVQWLLILSDSRSLHLQLKYNGTSWFEHHLTRTLPNPNTFGEQILTSYSNAASQFEHKNTWRPMCLPASRPVSLALFRREHLSLMNSFQVTPAPNPGHFLPITPVNAAFYSGHWQTYLLMKIYLTL